MSHRVTSFAPASVGNIAVGFDLLGHALAGVGDTVTLTRTSTPTVQITQITGLPQGTTLPLNPAQNTATKGLLALLEDLRLPFGFDLQIHKGIPLGSGMGGSAASAAAAIHAASALLPHPLTPPQLYHYALLGESLASGAPHGDNLAPALFGGIQAVLCDAPMALWAISPPKDVWCALVHPHMRLDTKIARAVLNVPFDLGQTVGQTGRLLRLIHACTHGDLEGLRHALDDRMIEPLRAPLIPGFSQVKAAALAHGALGAGISGAGPSVFAWCPTKPIATTVAHAMRTAFLDCADLDADIHLCPLDAPGAHHVDPPHDHVF